MCTIFLVATVSASCSLWVVLVLVKEINTVLGMLHLVVGLLFLGHTAALTLLWDGRTPFNLTNSDLNMSVGPFGSEYAYAKSPALLIVLHQWCEGIRKHYPCMSSSVETSVDDLPTSSPVLEVSWSHALSNFAMKHSRRPPS